MEIDQLTQNEFRLFGTALYWAEGSKTHAVAITNSDPDLIIFMVKWFERIFNIPPDLLKAHLNLHKQQDEEEAKKFWSDITGIPLENFGKSFIKPEGTGYRKNILYHGTIKVRYCSKDLLYRILTWIREISMGH